MSELTITNSNFETEVLQSDLPVLVDFWASWCGPCRMLSPIVKELADEYAGKIKVGKVNVDEEMDLAVRFHISSIPALLLFQGGQTVTSLIGYRPKSEIEEQIQKLL